MLPKLKRMKRVLIRQERHSGRANMLCIWDIRKHPTLKLLHCNVYTSMLEIFSKKIRYIWNKASPGSLSVIWDCEVKKKDCWAVA
jgi:hypothetical protein